MFYFTDDRSFSPLVSRFLSCIIVCTGISRYSAAYGYLLMLGLLGGMNRPYRALAGGLGLKRLEEVEELSLDIERHCQHCNVSTRLLQLSSKSVKK